MRPDEADAALLWDMLRHAKEAELFVHGKTWEDYSRDLLLRRAVERSVSIVGEASSRVSKAFRDANPQIPWRPITAQRHILMHEYDVVQNEKIWRVATVYVPELIARLEKLIPTPPTFYE